MSILKKLNLAALREAIDPSRVEVDTSISHVEVKLLKTTFDDPHIKAIMAHVTGGDPQKEAALKQEVEEEIDDLKCVANVSPILYEAALDNIVETVLFEKFWKRDGKQFKSVLKRLTRKLKQQDAPVKKLDPKELEKDFKDEKLEIDDKLFHPGYVLDADEVKGAPKFDKVTFMQLVAAVKAESKSFFPLRNMIDFHVIKNPRITVSGAGDDKLSKSLASVDTAAATADGTFVFNANFCQALLDFAHLKGLKAGKGRSGQKYASNGGRFPDEWEYIEFLIRHEFMHYTYSDFHYRKIIPGATGNLINWVGDFRTNHRLVQQGFNQLPMGLFSSYVNFHKQGSYMEMYNLVKGEFDKLKEECKEELSGALNGKGDDHSQGGSDSEGNEREIDKNINQDDIDKWNKKTEKKSKDDEAASPPNYDEKPPEDRDPGTGKGGNHELDYKTIRPKYKWDELLRKMIGESTYTLDQSYQKVSRRAIGTMQQVIKRGSGAVKPGDVKNPNKKKIKLAIIIDSSGSMSYIIKTVMANVDQLLIKRSAVTNVQDEFFLFIFSGDYDIYVCTPGAKGSATHVTDVDKKVKGPLGQQSLGDVLNHHKSGGTVFGSQLAGEINKLAKRGYNCLVVSDGDMLHGENFTNFKELYDGNRKHVWILLDSKETFATFISQMKEISNNASHL